jgi:signal transduction histidine kinase
MALKTIADRNAALTKFIGNYRQLSRLPMPERKELRISDLLEEIKELHHHQCKEKGISCTIHPGPAMLSALADESQVKQVLINLVKNAMEAVEGDGNGRMEIRTKRILDEVSIEISDNGSGIPQDILEKIFVPFYTTKQEGSGIGLSLSRQIIRNHGGQISVESEPASGTTFKITLPVNDSILLT